MLDAKTACQQGWAAASSWVAGGLSCALRVESTVRLLRDQSRDPGPTHRTPFNLHHLFRGPVSKCSHAWGRGFDVGIWGGIVGSHLFLSTPPQWRRAYAGCPAPSVLLSRGDWVSAQAGRVPPHLREAGTRRQRRGSCSSSLGSLGSRLSAEGKAGVGSCRGVPVSRVVQVSRAMPQHPVSSGACEGLSGSSLS